MALLKRKPKSKAPPTIQVGVFHCAGVAFPIPREQLAKTEFLTRKKRLQPEAYDEAILKFETEVSALTGGQPVTAEVWAANGSAIAKARVKATMAVLMSFGVTQFPVPADQEARARALATPEPTPSDP